MNRVKIAWETVKIQQQGYYDYNGLRVDISVTQKASEEQSFLINPEQERKPADISIPLDSSLTPSYRVVNQPTVQTILEMNRDGKSPAVLNFASAKRPGGAFLAGGMAQEESLAASSGLYNTLLRHPTYYSANRKCGTAMYTNHAIYSPGVVFFRDSDFKLLKTPVTASVLTLPAVNIGQVRIKHENVALAKEIMKSRMRFCLSIFAERKDKYLILGAYGCGVFRNDPAEVAAWWRELLQQDGYGQFFQEIVFAVLDKSSDTIKHFNNNFYEKGRNDLI